jgi:DNA polymerase-3 subunit delta
MADLKPIYLVSGDDDAKIDAWRARLRDRAEAEGGPGALEAFDASTSPPGDIAAALLTMTMAAGTRYLMADGIQAWKAKDVDPLEQAVGDMPPETVLVLIARGKPLERLAKAVSKAGGEVRSYAAPKPWEMPKWVVERAAGEGLRMDLEGARALVSAVGAGALRLAREIEKLALMVHPRGQISAQEIEEMSSDEATAKVYDLADALIDADPARATALAEALVADQERPGGMVFPIVRRLREVHRAAALLDLGMAEKDVAASLGQPPWLAKKTLARARQADRQGLERALCAFADLEVDSRGGGNLDEATAFSLTLVRAASG